MTTADLFQDPEPSGRPGPPALADRDPRARAVLNAAVAVLAERGLHATTLQHVADRAGMGKILTYRFYPTRQALIDALFGELLAEIEAIAARPWGGYGSGLAALVELGRAKPALYLSLLREARGDPESAPWATACDGLLSCLAEPFVAPPADASPQTRAACAHAARAFRPFITEVWIAGIESSDGMTDAARVRWFGAMVLAWRIATYEALGLPPGPEPVVLGPTPPPRGA